MEILEIKLQSDDLFATEKFYTDILGLELLTKDASSISFKAGHSKLSFIKSENLKPTYHFAFNIPHNKLEEAINWSRARLELIPIKDLEVVADFKNWNAKSIYFYDNNKNVLEFIVRFDLDNAIETDFSAEAIQGISEIGLIADKPLDLAEELIKDYDLSYFSKGAQYEKFKTLGTDEGLIIIVQSDHDWYPTRQSVKKHFLEIKLSDKGKIKHIEIEE